MRFFNTKRSKYVFFNDLISYYNRNLYIDYKTNRFYQNVRVFGGSTYIWRITTGTSHGVRSPFPGRP